MFLAVLFLTGTDLVSVFTNKSEILFYQISIEITASFTYIVSQHFEMGFKMVTKL